MVPEVDAALERPQQGVAYGQARSDAYTCRVIDSVVGATSRQSQSAQRVFMPIDKGFDRICNVCCLTRS